MPWGYKVRRQLWPLLALLLPLLLVATSLATLARLSEFRDLYLRNRAAALVARLEVLQAAPGPELLDSLLDEEPALVDLHLFDPEEQGPEAAVLASIREGRELFHTERVRIAGTEIFRAYIPCHAAGRLRIARIDLAASAADFLLLPARRNVLAAALSGVALTLLALYALWSLRRTAQLERRQLEMEQLARLGRMAATLAHEIRNPLATIKGFVQLAAEKASPDVAALLGPVSPEIERLERLVKDLLQYGRPVEPRLAWVNWDALAAELETNARQLAGGSDLRIRVFGGPIRLKTDPDLLKAALLNLVRNAVEASGESGEVAILIEPSRDGLVIAVEDEGSGIPAEVRRRLFEPFYTTKAFGSGLGLATSRKLVETLGGRLDLVDRQPRGTRAEIRFPRMEWTGKMS
ncbi:MAG: sensor histidine kinase [Bryobacteraceae bacterium]